LTFDYAAIGTVSVASRLCDEAKPGPCRRRGVDRILSAMRNLRMSWILAGAERNSEPV